MPSKQADTPLEADPGQRWAQEKPAATRLPQSTLRGRRIIERLKRRREEAV
ncbi:hypothetical protein WMF31_09315 [Sorangium sp. So ce1036]|uniref:hypothetical protein n=1 Tax=Sorangium sp. So ce1036 TaxID=3133328 RepID=UPI003F123DB3